MHDDFDHLRRWEPPGWVADWPAWLPLAIGAALGWLLVIVGAGLATLALIGAFHLVTRPAHAAAPTTSPQWVDITQHGADPTDTTDSTAAIQASVNAAIAGGQPLYLPYGTYKVSNDIDIDYAGVAASGFRVISDGATLDGRSIVTGPVLLVDCSGGSPSLPTGCFYFKEEGTLFIEGSTSGYAFVLGKTDFSDAQNSAKIDHLIANNASTASTAGGCQFNYVLDSDIYAVCNSAGGGAGLALEQVQFSWIEGAGTASGSGGRSIVLENGYDFSNTLKALDLEVSPICLSITTPHNGLNTFFSPYLDCQTAISATASTGNTLINPNYGGAVVNYGPLSTGISVLGPGSRGNWLFPSGASYTAAPVDDGLSVSSYNATGASLAVTLPSVAAVNPGWTMGFASDNGKGMTVAVPDGALFLSGGLALGMMTLGPGNYEYLRLQSDGSNWRVLSASRNTQLQNNFEPPPWPARWLYPSTSGYAATAADNGNTLSSYNSASGLTVTLPPTTGLNNGWSMGFATDNGHGLTVAVNAASGGHILYPGSGALKTSVAMAGDFPGQVAYEAMVIQYDGSGNFRIVSATPATAGQLQMLGTSGINRYSFPSGSTAYTATFADNGNMISSANSPSSFMAVTLPATATLSQGFTIGIQCDNNITMSVQTSNGSAGILLPGGAGSVASFTLFPQTLENAVLQFDGQYFRVVWMAPLSANYLGLSLPNSTPATSSAPCTIGAFMHDANYLYVCTATNTWKRAALSSF
jgi:Pectate lyase superfamily protein